MEIQTANQSSEPPLGVNTLTKDELLHQAKAAIDASDKSMREAAEALAIAQELHGASQVEMARAVGKSETWVSRLLQWRREGYRGDSPFGPTTKAGRLAHAQDRASSGASKLRKPSNGSLEPNAAVHDAETGTEKRKAVYANVQTAAPGAGSKTPSQKALAEFKYAVNSYVPRMNDEDKEEARTYFLEKAGVAVS